MVPFDLLSFFAIGRTCTNMLLLFFFFFFFLSRKDFKGADEKVWGGVWVGMNL